MERIVETLAIKTVLAPQSVSASTDTTTGYVDASGADEVDIIISTAALGAGKGVTATLLTATDASGSNAEEVGEALEFTDAAGTAALGAGKGVTATLLTATDASGSNAEEVGEALEFTDAAGTEAQAVVVSYKVDPQRGRYVAVKFQHDAAAAVICSAVAAAKMTHRPAANAWTALL